MMEKLAVPAVRSAALKKVKDAFWDFEPAEEKPTAKPVGRKLSGSLLSKVSIAVLATAALSFAIVLGLRAIPPEHPGNQ